MAVKVMGWVWDFSRSKGAERLVLLAIADCANASGNDAWPSMAELVRKTRLSERGVQKSIRKLSELGELKVSASGGRGRTNRYRIIMQTPNEVRGSSSAKPRTGVGVSETSNPEQGAGFSEPRTGCGVSDGVSPGQPQNEQVNTTERGRSKPRTSFAETPNTVHPEPSTEPSTYSEPPSGSPRDAASNQPASVATPRRAHKPRKPKPKKERTDQEQARFDAADRIAHQWWDDECPRRGIPVMAEGNRSPMSSFPGFRGFVEKALTAGISEAEIKYALVECGAAWPTRTALERAVTARRGRNPGAARPTNQHTETSAGDQLAEVFE